MSDACAMLSQTCSLQACVTMQQPVCCNVLQCSPCRRVGSLPSAHAQWHMHQPAAWGIGLCLPRLHASYLCSVLTAHAQQDSPLSLLLCQDLLVGLLMTQSLLHELSLGLHKLTHGAGCKGVQVQRVQPALQQAHNWRSHLPCWGWGWISSAFQLSRAAWPAVRTQSAFPPATVLVPQGGIFL